MKENTPILSRDGVSYLVPFVLITFCFALWGFANDITNPMVKAFSKIFRMSVTDGALVQVAFYGGYFAMAIPAALFIRKFSYKSGVLVGLGLYALGAFLFWPAEKTGSYYPFLLAYFIMTCGLSFPRPPATRSSSRWARTRRQRGGSTSPRVSTHAAPSSECSWR